jgi:hypothetical protein
MRKYDTDGGDNTMLWMRIGRPGVGGEVILISARKTAITQVGTGEYTYELIRDFFRLPEGQSFGLVSRLAPIRRTRLRIPAQGSPGCGIRPRGEVPGRLGQRRGHGKPPSSSLSRRPTSIPIRSRKLIGVLRSLPPGSTLSFRILSVPKTSALSLHDGDPCIAADTIGAAAADMRLPSWPTSGTSTTAQAQLVCSAAAIACPERT